MQPKVILNTPSPNHLPPQQPGRTCDDTELLIISLSQETQLFALAAEVNDGVNTWKK